MTASTEPKPLQVWLFAQPDPVNSGSFGEPVTSCNMKHVVEGKLAKGYKVVERDPSGKLTAVDVELGPWGYEKKTATKPSGSSSSGGSTGGDK